MAPQASRAAEAITTAIDLSIYEPFYKRKNGILLYFLLTSSFLSSLASGFDGSMTNAMQLLPQWQSDFGHPTGSSLGFFGASSGIGGAIALIFFNWIGDYFGRRLPTAIGAVIIIGGALMETFSKSLNVYIGGKIILGMGTSIVQMGAPVLITELSHPKERVRVTSLYNTSVLLGYVVGAWVTFGCIKISGQWQWKLPTILQAVPSIYQILLIGFSPESPRWLIAHGKEEKAREILVKYHGDCDPASELVAIECFEIKEALAREAENNVTWGQFFRSKANRKRIFLCTCIAVFSQSTGNLLISNFLSSILKDTGLNSSFESTLINGMVTLFSYLVAVGVAFLMDSFRRRTFFLFGCGGILVVLVAWTIASEQFVDHGSVVGGRIVIACIFLYQGLYSVAWLNLVVTYPLELVPYHMRAKTWSYVLLVIYIAQIFGNYVNPVGLENIGWKFYIYLDVWTAICLVIVYFFFIETQGPSLEELAMLFDDVPEGKTKTFKNIDNLPMSYEAENVKLDHTTAKV